MGNRLPFAILIVSSFLPACDESALGTAGTVDTAVVRDATAPPDFTAACAPACLPGASCVTADAGPRCVPECRSTADCQQRVGPNSTCCAGVCTDLWGDPMNCGKCGNACASPCGYPPNCQDYYCDDWAGCNAGYCDCNKSGIDGCEVDIATDSANCGKCGLACPMHPNSIGACFGGTCRMVCLPGWTDCNHSDADGCEIVTDGDRINCGACGNVCPTPPQAVPACDSGKCSLRCLLGFGDCNGKLFDGCETQLVADTDNCGHCGARCLARPNAAVVVCAKGQCSFVCDPGHADCDASPFNGCEVDLRSDPANCGACGAACNKGQSCVDRACR
jgi:hypothetical protein